MKSAGNSAGAIVRLQTWYRDQCDGDWEHTYGVKIDTIDNPGWSVAIDLADTEWSSLVSPRSRIERGNGDWIQVEAANGKFVGCGGVINLDEIIKKFFEILDSRDKD